MSTSLYRTHQCSHIKPSIEGEKVTLSGWVSRVRDHGGVCFFDLRDRSGLCQVVFPENSKDHEKLRAEFVVKVDGVARKRPQGMANSEMESGEMELLIENIEVLSEAEPLPFQIDDSDEGVNENTRLKYRYLDLRRGKFQRNLKLRHEILQSTRNFFSKASFLEIETPILYKSTPEGARDYLVPSRVYPGSFFALPQSPQTLKQLLMISGFERYFQIARCFRDEDLRADRQPEFTQLDMETSFMDQDEIIALLEDYVATLWKEVLKEDLKTPFERISHHDAIRFYGSDKPDLRFGLKLKTVSTHFANTEFKVFSSTLSAGGQIVALAVRSSELGELPQWSRKDMESFNDAVTPFGLKGVAWMRLKGGELSSPIAKFLSEEEKKALVSDLELKEGDYAFLGAADESRIYEAMGNLRLRAAKTLGLIKEGDTSQWKFVWVMDFPLFEYDAEDERLYAAHHPFTRPHQDDEKLFLEGDLKDLIKVRAHAYDLALNGFELGGGSLRIFESKIQERMFNVLGLSKEEIQSKFGFFVDALKFGTPPHGGIAFGVDRIAMLMTGSSSLRDVIAFPKTASSMDLMSESPSPVASDQLAELRIGVSKVD